MRRRSYSYFLITDWNGIVSEVRLPQRYPIKQFLEKCSQNLYSWRVQMILMKILVAHGFSSEEHYLVQLIHSEKKVMIH